MCFVWLVQELIFPSCLLLEPESRHSASLSPQPALPRPHGTPSPLAVATPDLNPLGKMVFQPDRECWSGNGFAQTGSHAGLSVTCTPKDRSLSLVLGSLQSPLPAVVC